MTKPTTNATRPRSARTRIGAGGRIVIPRDMRAALGVAEGDEVLLELDQSGLHVRSSRQTVALAQQAVARYAKPGQSLSAELIAERRREAKRE
jgi:AbrB family looped-hinge helix DNA binding protein